MLPLAGAHARRCSAPAPDDRRGRRRLARVPPPADGDGPGPGDRRRGAQRRAARRSAGDRGARQPVVDPPRGSGADPGTRAGRRVTADAPPTVIALAGNPNVGKTTLFNALTGLRGKVSNYPGVTVERKEGRWLGSPKNAPVIILDLPGTYSLSPQSLDEQVARDVLFHRVPGVPAPDVVV